MAFFSPVSWLGRNREGTGLPVLQWIGKVLCLCPCRLQHDPVWSSAALLQQDSELSGQAGQEQVCPWTEGRLVDGAEEGR